ncbi:MAG TPA: hypothetical protein VIO61_10075 [Anaerolineaceae bacterium]
MKEKYISLIVLIAMVAGLAFSALPNQAVYAASPDQGPQPPVEDNKPDKEKLEKAYKVAGEALAGFEKRIDAAEKIVSRLEDAISKVKQSGKNPEKFETALKKYKETLNQAKDDFQKAQEAYKTHAGFDANGKVTDTDKAIDTLKTIRQNLEHARRLLIPEYEKVLRLIRFLRINKAPTDK